MNNFNIFNKFVRSVNINLIETCNFRCYFCPISEGYGSSSNKMELETAEEISKQLQGFTGMVSLTSRGESFLHPQFDKILDMFDVSERTYNLKISHNSSFIDNISEKLDRFDEVCLMVYRKEDYFSAMNYKENKKSSKQSVSIKCLLDEESIIEFCNNRAGAIKISNDETPHKPCFIPFRKIMIHWDGSYLICCHDWTNNKQFDDIFTYKIHDFYVQHSNYKYYCRTLLNGERELLNPCKKCNVIDHNFEITNLEKFGRKL